MDIRNFYTNSAVSSSEVRVNDDIRKNIQVRAMLHKLLELTMRQMSVLLQWGLFKRERYAT